MVDIISQSELLSLSADGAEIELEARNVSIEGLAEVVASLQDRMEKIAKDRAEADAKLMDQLDAAMGKIATAIENNRVDPIDLRPVLKELVNLQRNKLVDPEKEPAPRYVFNVKRNQRGYITSVQADPVESTKH